MTNDSRPPAGDPANLSYPDTPPDDTATFNTLFHVTFLPDLLEKEFDGTPGPNKIYVPTFLDDPFVFAPSTEIRTLIEPMKRGKEETLCLIASFSSFYSLPSPLDDKQRQHMLTLPLIQFCLEESLPLIVFANEHWTAWDEAIPITIHGSLPILPCFPSMGLARKLGILRESKDGGPDVVFANGLFLIRCRGEHARSTHVGSWVNKDPHEPHNLSAMKKRLSAVRIMMSHSL